MALANRRAVAGPRMGWAGIHALHGAEAALALLDGQRGGQFTLGQMRRVRDTLADGQQRFGEAHASLAPSRHATDRDGPGGVEGASWMEAAAEAERELSLLAESAARLRSWPAGSSEAEVERICEQVHGWEGDMEICRQLRERVREWAEGSDDIGKREGFRALAEVIRAKSQLHRRPVAVPDELLERVTVLLLELQREAVDTALEPSRKRAADSRRAS
jgi:hypothetical protein